ncbi:hypothetical protein KH5H1_78500 [Corallococcus caeni]|nr:hypothetical protein KH5H1_78500 [Corallococcus sp. KH5-1]
MGCARLQPELVLPSVPPAVWMDQVSYDGFQLTGRILIEGRSNTFVDRRLNDETIALTRVRTCSDEAALPVAHVDYLWKARDPTDVITLRPSEFFGKEESFLLFTQEVDPQGGPDCIRFTLNWAHPGMEGGQRVWLSTFEGKAVRSVGNAAGAARPAGSE